MTTIETEKNNVFHIVDNTYTQSAYKMMPPNYQVNGCTFNFLCKKHSKVKKKQYYIHDNETSKICQHDVVVRR